MKVFLYGTLMKGHSNHHLIKRANGKFVSKAIIRDKDLYFVFPNSFPAVVDGKGEVFGEIYDIPDTKLEEGVYPIQLLDSLEGYNPKRRKEDNMYLRKRTVAIKYSGEKVWCSYYYWNGVLDSKLKIPNGDWGKSVKKLRYY